jgi:hypothetical protein
MATWMYESLHHFLMIIRIAPGTFSNDWILASLRVFVSSSSACGLNCRCKCPVSENWEQQNNRAKLLLFFLNEVPVPKWTYWYVVDLWVGKLRNVWFMKAPSASAL